LGQLVGGDGLIVVAVGRTDAIAALLAATQAPCFHEAGDAIAAMAATLFAQRIHNARSGIVWNQQFTCSSKSRIETF
jgi:hypothetical protein